MLPRDGDLATAARERHPDGFDAVLDLVNYTPDVPASLVKDGGRVASPTGAAGEGPGRTMVMAAPTPENLERLGGLLADGTLRVPVQETYELPQAPDALIASSQTPGDEVVNLESTSTLAHDRAQWHALTDSSHVRRHSPPAGVPKPPW